MVDVQDTPAGIAAGIGGLPHALVTDRCDAPLRHLDESALVVSGLRIDRRDMRRGSGSLHAAFDRVARTAEVTVTDRPRVPEPDGEISIARAQCGNRPPSPCPSSLTCRSARPGPSCAPASVRGPGRLVGSIECGAAVSVESRQRLAEYCVLAHRRLRRQYPDPRLVLLIHEGVEDPDGVVVRGFLPDRMTLPKEADFLVTTPDWATGATVGRVPTLFVLGGPGEYHEAEEFDRLARLGLPAFTAPVIDQLGDLAGSFIGNRATATPPVRLTAASGIGPGCAHLATAARTTHAGRSRLLPPAATARTPR
ncbi:hypothetical protein ABZ864_07280 [Streptomyces sp. NPDC047082]|uniref:hypothetical protein n=1 Tax=Streptomyces sp. NPDC047082 TaxID=3155259 RepID=UPI0033DF0DCD